LHTNAIAPYNITPTPNEGRPDQQQDINANTATALDSQIEQSPSGHKWKREGKRAALNGIERGPKHLGRYIAFIN
jgi:hypothetical protein